MPKQISVGDMYKEIIEGMLKNKIEIKDNTIRKKCSKCGECCSCFLPICQEELDIIQEYVIKNNIKPQTQMLVMQNRVACPYYDGKKCLIYQVRPLICKEFYCNMEINIEAAQRFMNKKYVNVNMWEIAKEIEKERKMVRKEK